MAEFPSGTVTFLFTDIEGSTRLLRELRDQYKQLRDTHHRLLRAAFEAHGGKEIGKEGDAFFAAFGRAGDAVASAVAAQTALFGEPWPPGTEIRVRMGIHTGEPSVDEEGYLGLALHFAARLTSAGHGGQVLLSKATYELVADELPHGVQVSDLGEHRLKDFDRPQPLYQLVIEGLPADFRPLKTIDLQEAETTVARRGTELVEAAQAVVSPRRIRRRDLLPFALIGVLAAAISIPIFALGRGSTGGGFSNSNSVVAIDPRTNSVVGGVRVGQQPSDVVFARGALWVANLGDETISRVDPRTVEAVKTLPADGVKAIAASPSGVWFLSTHSSSPVVTIRRINSRYNMVTSTINAKSAVYGGEAGGIGASQSGVWIVTGGIGRITRIDEEKGTVDRTINAVSCCPSNVALGAGAVWVTDPYANKVTRVDEGNLVKAVINVGHGPTDVVVGGGSVWVTISQEDKVARIDPDTDAVDTTVRVGHTPTAVAFGAGAVWVANTADGTVSRINPKTNEVDATIVVGESLHGIAFAEGRVWVTVQRAATKAPVDSGIARLNALHDVDSVDPAIAYVPFAERTRQAPLSWQIEYATCAKLINYPDVVGAEGATVLPEVARSAPAVSSDGRTFVFTIRKGFRFSPPSNEKLRAETFKRSIERALSPQMGGPARPQVVLRTAKGARATLDAVIGAVAYSRGDARHIRGIVASGDKLTFRLTGRVPDFLYRLAQPFFCPVPSDTPSHPTLQPIPSAGPYYIASYSPGRELVLRRNPNYTGTRPHHLKELRISIGVDPNDSLRQVEQGQADYVVDGISPRDHTRLSVRYGASSAAANKGKQRYLVNPTLDLYFVALNTSRPAFSSARLRRAANYAIDRRRLADFLGAISLVEPTDQYLPPTMPGFRDATLYPATPRVLTAKRLSRGRSRNAVLYACDLCQPIAQELQADLSAAGVDLTVREFPLEDVEKKIRLRGEPFDLAFSAWTADYPDPATFLTPLFDGNTIRAANNFNIAYFDDTSYNRRLEAASRLTGAARYRAYGQLDVELARSAAPVVAVAVSMRQDFFSRRMGCRIYNPAYGIDLAALCIKPS